MPSIDRKFAEKRQKWHPYRQFGDGKKKAKENISAIWERKYLKHSEYQDTSGVKFPSATGNPISSRSIYTLKSSMTE